MKPAQIGALIAVAAAAAVGGGFFVKWQSSRNVAPAPVAVASQPVSPVGPSAAPAEPEAQPSPFTDEKPQKEVKPARKPRVRHAVETESMAQNQPPAEPAAPAVQPPAPEQVSRPEPPAAAPASPAPVEAEAPAPPPPPPPRKVTLAAGTLIPARTIEGLSTDRNQAGDTFTATLDQPLVVDGLVIAERGAHLEGKIVRAERAGRVKGVSDLAIELTQLNLSDGQRVEIETETFEKHGNTSKREDTAKVGAGAALGAIIGAIAGGGKGAGIGAAAGGAAGAGDVLVTRGKAAELKPETRINFRLRNSVTITERRS
ncbi:MAG TPA: hypothetical protein VJN43_18105 [Bryobacteraceae bacterium]|nr:hypothetical protein [Bryobacteraceae bacterium]